LNSKLALKIYFLLFGFGGTKLELRASRLLGKLSHLRHSPISFGFSYFPVEAHIFCLSLPEQQPSYPCFLLRWDYRCVPTCSAFLLRLTLTNFLVRLDSNFHSSNPIATSQVAEIIGVRHYAYLGLFLPSTFKENNGPDLM
jgi:hypothetical protein